MINIIPIEEKHIQGFYEVLGFVASEQKYITFTEPPPFEGTKTYVLGNINNGHPHFIALDGDRVVGWCDAPFNARATMKHVFHLGIGLLPAYRHLGIGRQLMVKTIDDCINKGAVRIELRVYENNENAIKLYQSLGFEIEGLLRKDVLLKGEYINAYMMSRLVF